MELVEGGSLRPLIGELSLPKVARVLEDLLAAVGYAGRSRHRAPRPQARERADHQGGPRQGRRLRDREGRRQRPAGLTSEGMTVGTPEYMSPEQALARDVGPASDLYSVGCMTYEMLTGRLPFSSDSQAALLVAHVNEKVPGRARGRSADPRVHRAVGHAHDREGPRRPLPRRGRRLGRLRGGRARVHRPAVAPRRDARAGLGDRPVRHPRPDRHAAAAGQAVAVRRPDRRATGYQTYQAPAALHELLGDGRRRARRRHAAADAGRAAEAAHVTPPPMPATSGSAGARERDGGRRAPRRHERKLPVGAIAAAAIVALIIAFVTGMSGGGSTRPRRDRATASRCQGAGGLEGADDRARARVGDGAVSIAPPGAAADDGIIAGRTRSPQAEPADPRRRRRARQARRGRGRARLERQPQPLHPADGRRRDRRRLHGGAGRREACDSVAGSLEITRGTAAAPGPTDAGARALGGALTRLRDAIRNPTEDLGRAKSAARRRLPPPTSEGYRAASPEVRAAPMGMLATAPAISSRAR